MLYRSCAWVGGWFLYWVKSGHLPRHKNHFRRLIKAFYTFPYVGQILSRLLRIIEWNQINTRAAGIIVVHSKFPNYTYLASCAYLALASGSAQCAADVSMTMRSRDKRAVKNARKQTSLFPMLFRFVFVIAALANWRGKAAGKQVKWKWSCKLIWQAASCLCKSMEWLDCFTPGRALSHEQAVSKVAVANQVA